MKTSSHVLKAVQGKWFIVFSKRAEVFCFWKKMTVEELTQSSKKMLESSSQQVQMTSTNTFKCLEEVQGQEGFVKA